METFFKLNNKIRLAITIPIFLILGVTLFLPIIPLIKILSCLIMLICIFLIYASLENNDITRQNGIINKVNNYVDTKEFDYGLISNDKLKGVLINKNKEEIITYHILENEVLDKSYNFNELLEVQLFTNKKSVLSVNKKGVVTGSLLGGALFGSVGAVIGAIGGSNKNINERISQISLTFTFNDIDNPNYELILNEFSIPQDINSEGIKSIMDEVNLWLKRFEVIIKRNEKLNNIS